MIRYGFETLNFPAVQASTDAANAASIRVLEKLGMSLRQLAVVDGLDTRCNEVITEPCEILGQINTELHRGICVKLCNLWISWSPENGALRSGHRLRRTSDLQLSLLRGNPSQGCLDCFPISIMSHRRDVAIGTNQPDALLVGRSAD
jgi:Acetyltransferase (GNAT) domain